MPAISSWQANLWPVRRVTSAKSLPCARFLAEQDAQALLLVSLKNESPKFVTILSETDSAPSEPLASDMLESRTGVGEPIRETVPSELVQQFDPDDLVGLVENTRHFVFALRKRPGFEEKHPGHIVAGRAKDADLVLCSPTVSKLHAWFEIDEEGSHWLTDKSSRNGTRVNGQRVPAESPTALAPGDRIEFGLVRAVFCPTTTFWRALHER